MDARSAAEARRAKILARSKQRIDSLTVGGEWRGPEEQPQQAQDTAAASLQAAPTPPPAQPTSQAPQQASSAATHQQPEPEPASCQQPDEWVHVPSMPTSASQQQEQEESQPSPGQTHSVSQAAPSTSAHPHATLHQDPSQHKDAQPRPLPPQQPQPPPQQQQQQQKQQQQQQQQQPQPPQQQQQQQQDVPSSHLPPSAELRNRQHPSSRSGAQEPGRAAATTPSSTRGALSQEPTPTDESTQEAETASKAALPAAAATITAADAPLNAAVRASRLIRCIVAVLYACSLAQVPWDSDSQAPTLPPLLVLMVVQLTIIFGAKQALLMPSIQHALGGKLHTLLPSGEVEVPGKLAGFDMWGFLLRLSPELRAIVASVASLAGVCKGILDCTALFLVAFVLMAPRVEAAG